MPTLSFAKPILITSMMAASVFPGLTYANYVYNYTGNPFQVTYTQITQIDTGDYITVETLFDTFLNAEIRTPQLLSAGSTTEDVTSIRFFADFLYGTLDITYPGPPPTPSDFNPDVGAYMNIGSVDANGIPTTWDVRIGEYVFLGGRIIRK